MLVPEYDEEIGEWWLRLRQRLDSSARPIFDSMFLLVAWNLWKERNSVTFGRAAATDVTALRQAVAREEDWVTAGFTSLAVPSAAWSPQPGPM